MTRHFLRFWVIYSLLLATVAGQLPNTLKHSIYGPHPGPRREAGLGYSVAVDGGYTVLGEPQFGTNSLLPEVVKVFDTASGELLFELLNPAGSNRDSFGAAVAVSGSRVVVGAPLAEVNYPNPLYGTVSAGCVYVYDLSGATPTVPVEQFTLRQLENYYYYFPQPTDEFGAAVAISGTRLVIGAPGAPSPYDNSGRAFVVDLSLSDPATAAVQLHDYESASNNPSTERRFGDSVAISGSLVAVGEPLGEVPYPFPRAAGKVLVFDLTTYTVPPEIDASFIVYNPAPTEVLRFGDAVAISGSQLVVGAKWSYDGQPSDGMVYVYDLVGTTPSYPSPSMTIPNPTPGTMDSFGASVAISGTKVVVGAPADDAGAVGSGSTYVYDLLGSTPTVPLATLPNPSPAANDAFGWAVTLSGTKLVVGAYLDDTMTTNAGSGYVYDLSSLASPPLVLNHPSVEQRGSYGASVAVSGSWMVVGLPEDCRASIRAGSVLVYHLGSATPTVPAFELLNPSPAEYDTFGGSVSISGTRVAVGAIGDDTGAVNAGSVYIYDLSGAVPTTPVATLQQPSPVANSGYGGSVLLSGNRLIVGASREDTGATNAGSVYVYDFTSGLTTVPEFTLHNPAPAADDLFGFTVAIAGTRLIVGTPDDDAGASNAGTVYVYDLAGVTPTVPMLTLANPNPAASDSFGTALAASGTRIVVGDYRDDNGATDSGSVYVYDLGGNEPTVPVLTLVNPTPAASDYFGYDVAISGTQVAVSAYRDTWMGVNPAGSVSVFDLTSATPLVPLTVIGKPNPVIGDSFGYSLAMDGTTMVVGVLGDDTTVQNAGAAFVYAPHPLDQDSDGLRDAWEQVWWPSASGHGPLDDEDQDGIVNLLEMAFDLNPTQGNGSPLPPAVNEGGYLTLTLTKQPGVTYEVQSAGTLLPLMPESFSAASTTVLLDNATTLKVRDNVLMSTPGGRFMRVQVTAAP